MGRELGIDSQSLYNWVKKYRAHGVAAGIFEPPPEKSAEAPGELRERLFAIWRDVLLDIGFMEEEKADHMMLGLRRVWPRGKMTVADVNILMGIARQMRWRSRHPG